MLNKVAFATSLALLTAGICLVFALLNLVSPAMFQLGFNVQFFGADVASRSPGQDGSHDEELSSTPASARAPGRQLHANLGAAQTRAPIRVGPA